MAAPAAKNKKVEAFAAPRLTELPVVGLHKIQAGGAFNEGNPSSEPIMPRRKIDCE
jgi:hypothetical protein